MGDERAPDPNSGWPWAGTNPSGGPVPPGYGFAGHPGDVPAGFGPPYPPAQVEPGEIRPRVLWIVLAWVLFAVSVVVGILLLVGAFTMLMTDAAPRQTFASGEQIELFVAPGDRPVIYASGDPNVPWNCYVNPPDAVSLTPLSLAQTVTVNGTTWYAVAVIEVAAPGRYQLLCESDGQFGIGKEIPAGWLIGGFVLPVAGFVIAVVTTIVVLVRRNSMLKRRLHGYAA
jgi:hypothetical protein